jgi:hypothetical protein
MGKSLSTRVVEHFVEQDARRKREALIEGNSMIEAFPVCIRLKAHKVQAAHAHCPDSLAHGAVRLCIYFARYLNKDNEHGAYKVLHLSQLQKV